MQSTTVSLHTWVCLVVCNFVVMRVYVTCVQMVSVFFYDLHTFWRSHELHLIKQERKGEYQDIRSKGETQRTFRTLALKHLPFLFSCGSTYRKYSIFEVNPLKKQSHFKSRPILMDWQQSPISLKSSPGPAQTCVGRKNATQKYCIMGEFGKVLGSTDVTTIMFTCNSRR